MNSNLDLSSFQNLNDTFEGYEHHRHHGHHGYHRRHHDRYFITDIGSNTPVLMMIFFMFLLLIALAFAKN